MSWIKDNKFVVALCGGTLAGVILLYFVGAKGAENYDKAKADFDAAASEAGTFETLPLYPSEQNRDGKTKALGEYRKAAEALQADFEKFRPKELKNIPPQEFTNHLKSVDDEVVKAFTDAGTKIPEAFFCGFEGYKTTVAPGKATGILDYQLEGVKNILLSLAGSKVSEVKNLHRPALPEEGADDYKPKDTDVARALPLELTFVGTEKSVRSFLSSVVKPEGQYVVIRTIRITNAKKEPPRAADAKFDKPAAAKPAAADNVFGGGGFVLPGDEPKADDKKPADAPKPAETPKPAAADSSRILSQVLGNEEVQVFVRLDLLQFLPAKKLP